MENSINCFQFKSHLSDFLSHSADPKILETLHAHLEQCKPCHTHHHHHQTILSLLENQPTSTLPKSLREAPFSAALPRMTSMPFSVSRWQKIPWYLRVLLECGLIVTGVITLVSSTPKLRELYENHIEKNLKTLEDPTIAFEDLSLQEKEVTQTPENLTQESMDSGSESTELNGEDESTSSNSNLSGSQLWRFTLKTVSPDELRAEILKVLNKFSPPIKTAGALGVQVPGGIEFNFLLPTDQINDLKKQLHELTQNTTIHQQSIPSGAGSDAFTWYRVHSKKKLPTGKAQVIIWISQPHAGG